MRCLAIAAVLGACGSAPPPPVANRGGTPAGAVVASCPVSGPVRVMLEARRYANLDADDPDYQKWTPWNVSINLTHVTDRVSGVLDMSGDGLRWKFDVAGTLDHGRCVMSLETMNTHEGLIVTLRLGDGISGEIHSIDDVWMLGSAPPARR